MKKQDLSLEVCVCRINNTECLKFNLRGELSYASALEAIELLKEYIYSHPNEKIPLIWNCLEMTGYKPLARAAWQTALKQMKNHVDSVWLITTSKFIQGGALLFSLLSPIKIKTVSKQEHIFFTNFDTCIV